MLQRNLNNQCKATSTSDCLKMLIILLTDSSLAWAAETFDELLLIKQGGRVIFSGLTGKESCNLIAHFEHIDGVPPIQQGHNPATWMLEISGTTTERNLGIDFADIYDRSDLAK